MGYLNELGKQAFDNSVAHGFRTKLKLYDYETNMHYMEKIANKSNGLDAMDVERAKNTRNAFENAVFKKLALIGTEVGELIDAFEKGVHLQGDPNKPGLGLSYLAEELADVFIRLVDFSEFCSVDLDSAVEKKMEYNKNRPFKHNKKN